TSLADAEAREGLRRGAALLEHLADGLLGVLGEGLLEQDVLLEEAVDATLDDAGQGSLGLALLLGRGLGDATLVLDRLGRYLLALRDEVGLAVHLDQGADAVGGRGRHEAVGGRAALTLRDALEALDAKDLDGLGAVALGLVEGLLDVHHAGARLLAQRLDVSG